jgi:hypothetical protein
MRCADKTLRIAHWTRSVDHMNNYVFNVIVMSSSVKKSIGELSELWNIRNSGVAS